MMDEIFARAIAFDDRSPLLFTQFYFWAFFALVLLALSVLGRKTWLRNAFLFFASLFFYYKTSGTFTLLLASAVVANFGIGLMLDAARKQWARSTWLVVGLIVDLGVLCYFKYAYFLVDVVNDLWGASYQIADVIMLPVGISFYTFQCISYQMDIYRRRIRPERNILDYGFYVSFFPQLVAGPIVRANEFMHQLHRRAVVSRRIFGMAVFWIVNGMAKKIILSDYIAVNFIDRVFENPTMHSGFENLLALFGYSLQVYADFSGYTDIAIGVAMIMGFYLPRNFHSPYKAPNACNFWKRWHISLSKWLQDYLYIPMGGNRRASFGTFAVIAVIVVVATTLSANIWVAVCAIFVIAVCAIVAVAAPKKRQTIVTNINSLNTMLLGGLWHGASWNFMIWGGLNGLGMIVFKLWRPLNVYARVLVVAALLSVVYTLSRTTAEPVWNIAVIWLGAIGVAATLRMLYNAVRLPWKLAWLERAWAVVQTFVFITFTRLFFRSGSNLDPAEANETAWNTAKNMARQIGSEWNTERIGEIAWHYNEIIALIIVGMAIHWLPERLKRRYRLTFAQMPLWLMALSVVVVVFVVYQFVTADLQKFIYFQF